MGSSLIVTTLLALSIPISTSTYILPKYLVVGWGSTNHWELSANYHDYCPAESFAQFVTSVDATKQGQFCGVTQDFTYIFSDGKEWSGYYQFDDCDSGWLLPETMSMQFNTGLVWYGACDTDISDFDTCAGTYTEALQLDPVGRCSLDPASTSRASSSTAVTTMTETIATMVTVVESTTISTILSLTESTTRIVTKRLTKTSAITVSETVYITLSLRSSTTASTTPSTTESTTESTADSTTDSSTEAAIVITSLITLNSATPSATPTITKTAATHGTTTSSQSSPTNTNGDDLQRQGNQLALQIGLGIGVPSVVLALFTCGRMYLR